MPDQSDADAATEAAIEWWSERFDQIDKPVTLDEAAALVRLFPEESLYGIEWALLHAVESVLSEPSQLESYRESIGGCPSAEWKRTLTVRLDNWQADRRG